MTVFLTPEGEPFYAGRTFRRSRATACRASGSCCLRWQRPGGSGGTTSASQAVSVSSTRLAAPPASSRRWSRSRMRSSRRRRPRSPARSSRLRRLRPRAEVPARLDDRVPAPAGFAAAMAMVEKHARRHGGRRHVRPRRRRLPPLLGRRPLARPALREDALRQRPARFRLPSRVGRHRRGARCAASWMRRSTTSSTSWRCPRAGSFGAGRRHRRRRGADVHVERAPRQPQRGSPRSCCSRSSTAASSSGERSSPSSANACSSSARNGRSPGSTTRRSPPGTASRSPRWPRPGYRLERRTG